MNYLLNCGFCSRPILITIVISLFVTQLFSQNRLPSTLSFQVDQDKFTKGNQDRNYTMGIYADFDSPCLDNSKIHQVLRNSSSFFTKLVYSNQQELSFGNNQIGVYGGGLTPDSLGTQSVIIGDRPYSSLVGITAGINYNFVNQSEKKYRKTNIQKQSYRSRYVNLMVAGLGLSFQGDLQTLIHSFTPTYLDTIAYINPVKPYGWPNQISNGGGLTGLIQFGGNYLLTSQYLTRFIKSPTSKSGWTVGENRKLNWFLLHSELKAGYQFMFGYYNNLQVNTEFRFGFIDPTRWVSSWTSNGSGNNLTRSEFYSSETEYKNKKSFELFLFAGARANCMIYNTLLRGQYVNVLSFGNESKYTLEANEVNPFFLSGNIGVALRLAGLTVSYSPISFRTAELKTQEKYMRTHNWGELKLKLSFK